MKNSNYIIGTLQNKTSILSSLPSVNSNASNTSPFLHCSGSVPPLPFPQTTLRLMPHRVTERPQLLLFPEALRPNAGHSLLILEVSRSQTMTHHSRQDASGRVISSLQRPLPDITQHSKQTNVHVTGSIRTRNFSRRATADLHLYPADTGTGSFSYASTYVLVKNSYNSSQRL